MAIGLHGHYQIDHYKNQHNVQENALNDKENLSFRRQKSLY